MGINVDHLRTEGIVLDTPMSREYVTEIESHLHKGTVHRYHVANNSKEKCSYQEALSKQWLFFASSPQDIVTAPHWLEQAISYYDDAKAYFSNRAPYLYSINAFWTLPSEQLYPDTQLWHRDDTDGPDQFTVFMFGTDVAFTGRHQYARGSHNMPYRSADPSYGKTPPDDDTILDVSGPRGTIIVEDTHGMHRALPTLSTPRLLLWARWYTRPYLPQGTIDDGQGPLSRDIIGKRYPEDPQLQEAIRLIVA